MTKWKNIPKAKITFYFFFSIIAVQHERGPRNSTIRKQMALLLKESNDLINAYHFHHYQLIPKVNFILNLIKQILFFYI